VTAARRDTARRITPEKMAFYKRKAHRIRAAACRHLGRAAWALLLKLGRRR